MQKKIKLKGSSYWDRKKPINKKRKMREAVKSIDSFSKRKPINKISKNKEWLHHGDWRNDDNGTPAIPYSATSIPAFVGKNIMEMHKGNIKIESKLGEGSKFCLIFP
jgi:hypothetical protein